MHVRSRCTTTVLALALLAVLAGAGCRTQSGEPRVRNLPRVPFSSTEVQVQTVHTRSAFIDATFAGRGFSGRLFFRREQDCGRIIVEGKALSYQRTGPWGRISGDGVSCEPVGIGTLAIFRDMKPRQRSGRGLPRAPAEFREVWRDQEVVILRGRFTMAGRIGWTRPDDTLAVVGNSEPCSQPIEAGRAQLEFRTNGPDALRLISTLGNCPLEGLIIP